MSDDDDTPAVNFNGDASPAVNFNGVMNKTNTASSSPSSPPTESKPSPSTSPSPSLSPSPSQPSAQQALAPPPTRTPPAFPAREDCWTEAATHTLIEAWGSHYIELNRGNLRQKHWQEVADAVNALHAHTKKQHRTDIQCKNRIDTLKKKYKIEKNQSLQSNGRYVSTWPFFNSLDALIGDTFVKNNLSISPSPVRTPARATTTQYRKTSPAPIQVWKPPPALPPPPSAVPVGPRSKRPVSEEVLSRRNFSAMAAAAARAKEEEEEEEDDDEEDEDEEVETSGAADGASGRKAMADGFKRLAEAVGRFAEIYERVEEAKQRQMVELEKQRMQFAKDLEIQRMKLFMESQVQLEKLKRAKHNSPNDGYS